ncbi:MAG TPA: CdaR family protein [Vicinamibacterales bacterium]|nr:CdaR family protein [Vicinamibacterales bacterium]
MRYRPRPFRNFGLKVLAVVLAALLWLVVSGEETVERSVRVPLELQQVPGGLDLMSEPPNTVDVLVRGASDAVSRMSQGDLVAVLDLRSARPGRRLFPLTPQDVRAPFGVEVVEITPSTVAMTFEKEGSRMIPIAPSVEGRPGPGYVIGQIRSNPASVLVVGPEGALDLVKAAMTEPVQVNGATAPVQEAVNVGVADPYLRLKTPVTANVTVNVIPAPEERTFTRLPLHIRNLAPRRVARAEPRLVTVTVRGGREAIDALKAEAVEAYIDVSGLGAGTYTLDVHADPGPDAGVARIDPQQVRVTIR